MLLYLVRHAEASRDGDDATRGLSEKGMNDARRVASHAAAVAVYAPTILHSDKSRARQTAEILAAYLHPEKGIAETDCLSPNDDPSEWAGRLKEATGDMMLVGHMPFMSGLASLLLSGGASREFVAFETASILCLRREGGSWYIEWMLTPRIAQF